MVADWLTFGLTPEQEARFRQAAFKSDIALTRMTLLVILPILAAFAFVDYIIFGLARTFYILLTLRFALLFYTVFFLDRLGRFKSYRSYDRAEFIWGLCFAAFVLITAATRSHVFIAHAIVVVLAVFITVFVIPNRFCNQIIISLVYLIGETLILTPHIGSSPQTFVTAFLTMCGANFIAILGGRQFHSLRRKEFLAHEEAEKARSDAAAQIEQLKRAEEAVSRSQKTLSELVERSPFGTYIIDSRFHIAHMNAASLTGAFRNVQPAIGRDFNEAMRILWPEPVAAEIISHFRHTLDTGEPYYSPRFTNPRHDVEIVESYEWELHRMTLPDGKYGVICYYYDSTNLRQAEADVRHSEALLKAVLENSPEAIYLKDCESRLLMANPATFTIVGKPAEAVIGKTDVEFYDNPATGRAIMENDRRIMASGRIEVVEESVFDPAGTRIYLSTKAPFRDAQGRIIGLIGSAHDITARKRAEEALRESEEKFRQVFERTGLGIALGDKEGRVIDANPALHRILGYQDGDLRGKAFNEFTHPDDSRVEWFLIEEMLAGRGDYYELDKRYIRRDGQQIWVHLNGSIVRGPQGEPVLGIATIEDITKRKRAEEELRASNQDLEEFNKAMVGRELRMIELKREINEICAKAGLPLRYPLDEEEKQP